MFFNNAGGMIPLQILSKSYKIAYEYRYKIGMSLESK